MFFDGASVYEAELLKKVINTFSRIITEGVSFVSKQSVAFLKVVGSQ